MPKSTKKSQKKNPAKRQAANAAAPKARGGRKSRTTVAEATATPAAESTTDQTPPAAKKASRKHKADIAKRTSALDAAAQVLRDAKAPMRCKEMITAMVDQGLWSSPAGKTPEATLHSAIIREIRVKGGESRFRKADRGLFVANG